MKWPVNCSKCIEKLEQRSWNISIPVTKSGEKEIYFSPVGTHYNFWHKKAPKVIIMGITTSGPALKGFRESFDSGNVNYQKRIKEAAIKNTFNGNLRRNLIAIINLTGILRLLSNDINFLQEDFFSNYNSKMNNYKILYNKCYFSQAILCASLKCNKSYIPKPSEVEGMYLECISSQGEILRSLKGKSELTILFGKNNNKRRTSTTARYCLEKADCYEKLINKNVNEERIVEIPHPSPETRVWNFLFSDKRISKMIFTKQVSMVSDHDILKIAIDYTKNKDKEFGKRVKKAAEVLIYLRNLINDI